MSPIVVRAVQTVMDVEPLMEGVFGSEEKTSVFFYLQPDNNIM